MTFDPQFGFNLGVRSGSFCIALKKVQFLHLLRKNSAFLANTAASYRVTLLRHCEALRRLSVVTCCLAAGKPPTTRRARCKKCWKSSPRPRSWTGAACTTAATATRPWSGPGAERAGKGAFPTARKSSPKPRSR